jgi:hypothetical protein
MEEVKRLADASAVRSGAVTCTTEPEIAQAWAEVRRDGSAQNWVLCSYKDKTTLALAGTGTGGLAELTAALSDGEVQYGAFRAMATDEMTTRPKFIFVTWVGASVGGMVRARASQHGNTVKRAFEGTHMDIQANGDKSELEPSAIQARIIAGSGAHAPKSVTF